MISEKIFWKVKHVGAILFVLLAGCFSLAFFLAGYRDNDYLWHSKVGEWILTNKTVPKTDVLSWIGIENETQFTAHSWLFGVLFYQLETVLSSVYLAGALYCAVGGMLLYGYLLHLLPKNSAVRFFITVLIGRLCSNPRPQVVGYLLFCIALDILQESLLKEHTRKLWFLPLLGCLWASYHGGTAPIFLGLAAFFGFLRILPNMTVGRLSLSTDGGYEGSISGYKKYLIRNAWRRAVLPFLGSLVGVLCNPYGFRILTYGFIENNSLTKKYVSEWQPGQIRDFFFILIACILLLLFLQKKKDLPLWKVACVLCCILAGSVYCRFLNYALLSSLFLLSDIAILQEPEKTLRYPLVFLVLSAIEIGITCRQGVTEDWNSNPDLFDRELVAYLQENRFERLYNTYNDGGKLLYEGIPSFIDQRAVGTNLIEDAILFSEYALQDKTEEEYLKQYQFDAVLLPKEGAASLVSKYFRCQSDWEVGYESEGYTVFLPSS